MKNTIALLLLTGMFLSWGCQSALQTRVPEDAVYIGGGNLEFIAPEDGQIITTIRKSGGALVILSTKSLTKGEIYKHEDMNQKDAHYFLLNSRITEE